MQPHKIVSREEWIEARKAHLAHEKEYTKARDRLSEERRALPWVKLDKAYTFDGPNGKVTLADLFEGRASLSCSTSCLARTGTRAARAARSGLTASSADPAPCRARHRPGCDLACAAAKTRGVQEADGLDV